MGKISCAVIHNASHAKDAISNSNVDEPVAALLKIAIADHPPLCASSLHQHVPSINMLDSLKLNGEQCAEGFNQLLASWKTTLEPASQVGI